MKTVQGRQLSHNAVPDPQAERLRPEQKLLLCAARVRMDSATAERMRALVRDPLDWAYLLGAARHHGLLPLLYWHLNESCSQAAPESVLRELHQAFVTNVQKNLILTDELLRILDSFHTQRIRLLPL